MARHGRPGWRRQLTLISLTAAKLAHTTAQTRKRTHIGFQLDSGAAPEKCKRDNGERLRSPPGRLITARSAEMTEASEAVAGLHSFRNKAALRTLLLNCQCNNENEKDLPGKIKYSSGCCSNFKQISNIRAASPGPWGSPVWTKTPCSHKRRDN